MKFLSIAIKDLKEILRDRRGFLFYPAFPHVIYASVWICFWWSGK